MRFVRWREEPCFRQGLSKYVGRVVCERRVGYVVGVGHGLKRHPVGEPVDAFLMRFTTGEHTKSLLTDILSDSRPLSSGTLTTEKSAVAACMAVAVASMASDKDIQDRLLCID